MHFFKHDLFIERMKKHIKKNKLTNELLAEKLNYSEHAVKRWMKKTEEHFPNMEKLVELSEICRCSISTRGARM